MIASAIHVFGARYWHHFFQIALSNPNSNPTHTYLMYVKYEIFLFSLITFTENTSWKFAETQSWKVADTYYCRHGKWPILKLEKGRH